MKLLAYAVVLMLLGCAAPRRKEGGLVQLPSAKDAEISRLTAENQKLTMELAQTQHDCRGVMEVFHKAGAYSRTNAAKEK